MLQWPAKKGGVESVAWCVSSWPLLLCALMAAAFTPAARAACGAAAGGRERTRGVYSERAAVGCQRSN